MKIIFFCNWGEDSEDLLSRYKKLTNNNLGTWKFDITGNGGTASISVELSGDDPSDLINQINIANIGITASLSDTVGKIKLTSTQEGLIKINNLSI